MSGRPKRQVKPIQRYEPVEQVMDDDYSEDMIDEAEAKKRLKGEFDGFDEVCVFTAKKDEEEQLDEPDEYDVEDGFAVPDDYEDEAKEEGNDEEEEESVDDDEDDDEEEPQYDDGDDDEDEKNDEPDVVDPDSVIEAQTASYLEEEGAQPMDEE